MKYPYGYETFWNPLLDKAYSIFINEKTSLQHNKTSFRFFDEIDNKFNINNNDYILVLNIETAVYLVEKKNINLNNIVAWSDNNAKLALYANLGIFLFIVGDFFPAKHIYNAKTGEKIPMKKFNIILQNPPYDEGLLNKNVDICNTNNSVINNAAKTRIDAAFVVHCYENLLEENGLLISIWPYVHTQLPSWNNFRKWMKQSGLKEIVITENYFEGEAATSTAITIQQKNYVGPAYYNNKFRNSNILIDWNYDIIPNVFGQMGYDIFKIEQKYPIKTFFSKRSKTNGKPHIILATGFGLGGKSSLANSTFKDWGNSKNLAGPFREENFITKVKADLPVIIFDSQEHKKRFKKYYNSNIFAFYLSQRKADFHNTKANVGIIPDPCKNMTGDYTDEKAIEELGHSLSQLEFMENIVGLPRIE